MPSLGRVRVLAVAAGFGVLVGGRRVSVGRAVLVAGTGVSVGGSGVRVGGWRIRRRLRRVGRRPCRRGACPERSRGVRVGGGVSAGGCGVPVGARVAVNRLGRPGTGCRGGPMWPPSMWPPSMWPPSRAGPRSEPGAGQAVAGDASPSLLTFALRGVRRIAAGGNRKNDSRKAFRPAAGRPPDRPPGHPAHPVVQSRAGHGLGACARGRCKRSSGTSRRSPASASGAAVPHGIQAGDGFAAQRRGRGNREWKLEQQPKIKRS
jgi:hypothetical protein